MAQSSVVPSPGPTYIPHLAPPISLTWPHLYPSPGPTYIPHLAPPISLVASTISPFICLPPPSHLSYAPLMPPTPPAHVLPPPHTCPLPLSTCPARLPSTHFRAVRLTAQHRPLPREKYGFTPAVPGGAISMDAEGGAPPGVVVEAGTVPAPGPGYCPGGGGSAGTTPAPRLLPLPANSVGGGGGAASARALASSPGRIHILSSLLK